MKSDRKDRQENISETEDFLFSFNFSLELTRYVRKENRKKRERKKRERDMTLEH